MSSVFSNTSPCSASLQPSAAPSWDPRGHSHLPHLPALRGQCSGPASSRSLPASLHTASLTAVFTAQASAGKAAEISSPPHHCLQDNTLQDCSPSPPAPRGLTTTPSRTIPGTPRGQLCAVCRATPFSASSRNLWPEFTEHSLAGSRHSPLSEFPQTLRDPMPLCLQRVSLRRRTRVFLDSGILFTGPAVSPLLSGIP